MAGILKYLLIPLLATLKNTDAAITSWTTPTISSDSGTGVLSVAEDQTTGATIETYVAVSDATLGDYSLVTTGTPFEVSAGGVLTINSDLDYETTSSYTLEIKAADDAPAFGIATITVTVTDVNEAPAFASSSYSVHVNDAATQGTTVTTVSATDQDSGDVIAYSIAAGDSNSHFMIDSSSGVIKVDSEAGLNRSTTAGYALQIEAVDDDGSPLTGTTTVFVAVGVCSGGTAIIAGSSTFLLALFLTLLQ